MNYHNITKDDMLNGDGLRVVLWVSGCTQNCNGCHNPQTHSKNSGILFDENAENELFEALSKPYCSGLTLSGGHPLEEYNISECTRIAKKFKTIFPNKTLWVYTGFLFEDIKNLEIINYIDVLCDGRFIESLKDNNKHWVGSLNQRVIDVKASLKIDRIVLYD